MAVIQRIRELLNPLPAGETGHEVIVSAPPTEYEIRLLTSKQFDEVCQLNRRCFMNGENYSDHTMSFLLSESGTVSYRATTRDDKMAGFIFVACADDGTAHITTIGVAPEHRRRGLAKRMLYHIEALLRAKQINTICLEVRVGNLAAQELYRGLGYAVVQRITKYYNNGEDGFLMVKSLV